MITFIFQRWCNVRYKGEEAEARFFEMNGLQQTTFRVIWEAKRQLLDLLNQAGFPEETMLSAQFNNEEEDPQLDLVLGILCTGLYPNVCYHKEKRKVLTTESKAALIHKTSVNCCNYKLIFPYPFFIFGEKIRTRAVACKQMSMVSPIHLLLFGSKKIDYVDNVVRLDNWINLEMDVTEASLITALRPVIQELVVIASEDPEGLLNLEDKYKNAISVIKDLCVMTAGDYQIKRESCDEMPTRSFNSDFQPKFQRRDGFNNTRGGSSGGYNNNRGGSGGGGYNNNRGFRGGYQRGNFR